MVFSAVDTQKVRFGALAILQIAEEVERKAAGFYWAAAEQSCGKEQRTVHSKLASWRRRRQEVLHRMQREHTEATGRFGVFDPDNYVLSNPRVMAGLTWSGTSPLPRGRSVRYANTAQILRDAITRSKGIVIFYHGLKGFAEMPEDVAVIDDLIGREDRHIRLLCRILARVQGGRQTPSTPRIAAVPAWS
jgi:rubrerythrin